MPGQVNYRESISREADIHYTHKKQSGGAGQYADISVRFEPGEPGSGFTFRSDIKGGAVSRLLLAAAPPRDAGGVGSGSSRAWLGPTCQGRLGVCCLGLLLSQVAAARQPGCGLALHQCSREQAVSKAACCRSKPSIAPRPDGQLDAAPAPAYMQGKAPMLGSDRSGGCTGGCQACTRPSNRPHRPWSDGSP